MRLFIGIPLAAETVAALTAFVDSLRAPNDGLRWSAAAGWHITLQFLGSATASQCECVKARLADVRQQPFAIQLESPGFFDRAGVFFVGVAVSPDLAALQARVTEATKPCGFVAEERPYHPHITLARSKSGRAPLTRLKSHLGHVPAFAPFVASQFLLYESFPDPGGSRYEVQSRFPL
jgi:2'-5' RNA ligase